MAKLNNLFATVLTYAAPSSNYRGESEENRTVLQKITIGGHEHTVISPESMRNALREILAVKGLPMNRRRLYEEDQLAVEFQDYPDATRFADDFLFGYLVADTKKMKQHKRPPKRDSLLRMNMAVALSPYRFNATFHQSPLNAGDSPWQNATSSALLHREVAHTAYQYPFALNLTDCAAGDGPAWTRALIEAIGELAGVAGGHARSYFEMSPKSIVVRLTGSLVAGFDTYGFTRRSDGEEAFAELSRISASDLPGTEFLIGGALARDMATADRQRLEAEGVQLFDSPQALLAHVASRAFEDAA